MNYIKHLASFFDRVAGDERLNPTHVSMYVSLFQFWNANRFQNPISISRNELMKVSKISAKATYHKCIKELNDYGYLNYKPSYNPFKGSLVYLFNFQAGNEQALVADHTKIETSIEQAQEPYINSNKHNKQNIVNIDKQAKKNDVQNLNKLKKQQPTSFSFGEGIQRADEAKKEKSSVKKENVIPKNKQQPIPFSVGEGVQRTDEAAISTPSLLQVQQYFTSQKYPKKEAEKFYNYFQSNGWLVGGRAQMKDWKAASRNWMLNANGFGKSKSVKPKAKHLHANTNKNYSEPL